MHINTSVDSQLTSITVHLQAIKPTSRKSGQRLTHGAGEAEESLNPDTTTATNRAPVCDQLDPQLPTTNPTPHTSRPDRCRRSPRSNRHHDADGDAVDGADGERHGRRAEEHGSGEDRRRDGEVRVAV